jgi:hypothetical protein
VAKIFAFELPDMEVVSSGAVKVVGPRNPLNPEVFDLDNNPGKFLRRLRARVKRLYLGKLG